MRDSLYEVPLVEDSFFPSYIVNELDEYCSSGFEIVVAGEKEFLAKPTPPHILEWLEIEGYRITLSFIRKAHSQFDTDWRIHADSYILAQPTDLARVVYLHLPDDVTGTAFWKHKVHGEVCEVGTEEFDRLIVEDANDLSKWERVGFVEAVTNRSLLYNAQRFHSKYPNKVESGERIVLVVFYTKGN